MYVLMPGGYGHRPAPLLRCAPGTVLDDLPLEGQRRSLHVAAPRQALAKGSECRLEGWLPHHGEAMVAHPCDESGACFPAPSKLWTVADNQAYFECHYDIPF